MSAEPEKTLDQIKAEFDAAMQGQHQPATAPGLSAEGEKTLSELLAANPNHRGRAVLEGEIQDGEFD